MTPRRTSRKATLPPPPQGAPATGVITLFCVQICHSYYNLANDRCPDFAVVPTPDGAALMARLGISFQDKGDGFIVYCAPSRLPAIASHLAAMADGKTQGGWLSFFLLLKNPAFVGITALPLDTNPTQQNLYASNLDVAKTKGGELVFGSRTGVDTTALLPVSGPAIALQTTADAVVSIADILGQTVASATAPANSPTTLSLAASPFGRYTISADPATAYAGPSEVAYVPTRPLTSGLIDLLLAQPPNQTGDGAAFPIAMALNQPPTTQTVSLVLSFTARATTWQYYVVSQSGRGSFGQDLSISGTATTFVQAAKPVALPNGEEAVLFSSAQPLPLRQHAPTRFKLSGQRHGPGGSRDEISIDRLPSAPAAPVWPASTGDALSGASEIFVHV
jgi:hypothetical protein